MGMVKLSHPVASPAATLKRLADELDVPVDVFRSAIPESETGGLLTLVRCWLAIKEGQGRRRVLSLARQEAERAGYKDGAS